MLKKVEEMPSGTGWYLKFDISTDENEALRTIDRLVKTHFTTKYLRERYPHLNISGSEVSENSQRNYSKINNPNARSYKLVSELETCPDTCTKHLVVGFINYEPIESRDTRYKTYKFIPHMKDFLFPQSRFSSNSSLVERVVKDFSDYAEQSINF